MHICWGDPQRQFALSTLGGRDVDAHRRRGLDFYGQILLWPPKYADECPVKAAWLGCTNVGRMPAVGLHPPHPVAASWTHTVAWFGLLWPDTSMATEVRAPMASASGVFWMHKCWGDLRRQSAPSTPGACVMDAHFRRGLDFYGQILLWPPKYAHEWPVQAAWLGCPNVGRSPGVGWPPPHSVVTSWTHTVGVVWTSMARYFYGHPSTRTNGAC